MVERLPSHVSQAWNDRPAAVHRLGPRVVLDIRDAAEGENFAGLKTF